MKGSLTNGSVLGFSFLLASDAPVPGGGSAAALIGALSAALCEMAGNLTVGKKKYAAYEDDQKRMIAAAEALRQRFLFLIEADAEAFEPLSKAYAMPKNDPNYAETMAAVTLKACQAPYQMLECCCEIIALLEEMLEKCSRLMISDVGCGTVAAEAAMKAAYLNVIINTRTLPENEEAILLEHNSEAMLNIWLPRAKAITDSVTESLRRK
ncbi:MAG: cyclodeaminase/cyclohydrolase family protein [Oscillospiraceae bacterium]|nr:cyclodeaminase/cyclohydrolase family protein [Oscillospiraceae bacterium]